jgi:hypothetical protein
MIRRRALTLFALPALIVAGAGLCVLFFAVDNPPTAPTTSATSPASGEKSNRPEQSPGPNEPDPVWVATAGDYELDAPRRRNELGQPLPFREAPLSRATGDLLRRSQRGNVISLELFPGIQFTARITGRWDDSGETRVAALLDGQPERDRLFMTWNDREVRGLLELPSRNLAYEIVATAGDYVVREWLFTDVICATPDQDTRSAERGLPRPLDEPEPARLTRSTAATAVPALSSRPGATAVIYLDFDGETVSGTAWDGGRTIVAPPARLNASQITEAWERVVRDFEVFDVNVTTSRAAYDAAPLTRRTHCIITSNDQASPGSGGVAYVNSFTENSTSRKICWVFMDDAPKSCADAVSHEVGHTLGLGHDGRVASGSLPREEYYEGHGSGPTGWAPIMGVGYYRQLTQWSRGEYARANNLQDDITIMGQSQKIPILSDDHGSTRETASNVSGDRVDGVIERSSDLDFFRVDLPAGTHSIFLQPAAFTNLDLELQVQSSSGALIASSNPVNELAASATFTLAVPQTVFLRVDGVGKGDVLGTGYSDYASLGLYFLSGFGNQELPPSPPIGVSTRRISGSQIAVTWTPNPSATYYQVFRDGLLLATASTPEFLDATAQPSTEYAYTVIAHNDYGGSPASTSSIVTSPAFDEFIMDGEPDFAGYLLADSGMTIYAAIRGRKLYVATWSPGDDFSGFGSDHHLFVSDTLLAAATTPAPWTKRGFLAIPGNKPYLAGEYESRFASWFNTEGPTALFKSPVNSGVMEGVIDLVEEFGTLPENIYVAAVAYGNEDNGGILSQAPSGNGNDNLEPAEFLRIPVRAIADARMNGVYDTLDSNRAFRANLSTGSGPPVVRWPVIPGQTYRVQGRDSLEGGSWIELTPSALTAGAAQWEMEFTAPITPGPAKFYRVIQP